MMGKYYGIYDVTKDSDESCVGMFESVQEIADFFGGIRLNRIHCAICRKNPLRFGKERYHVEVFVEPNTKPPKRPVREALRHKFGSRKYQLTEDGVAYYTTWKNHGWLEVENLEEIVAEYERWH